MTENHWNWIRDKQNKLMLYAIQHRPLKDSDFEELTEMVKKTMELVEKQADDVLIVTVDRKLLLGTLEAIDLLNK